MQSAPELGRLLGDLTAKDTMLLSPRDKANMLNALRRDVSPSKTAAFDADDPSEELTEEEELVSLIIIVAPKRHRHMTCVPKDKSNLVRHKRQS